MTQTRNGSDDAPLRTALQALPPDVDPVALDALKRRVLADWYGRVAAERAHQAAPGAAVDATAMAGTTAWAGIGTGRASDGPGGSGEPGGSAGNRRRWLAISALVIALVGLLAWSQRPDPVLEELMRMDVLSQMTAGQI